MNPQWMQGTALIAVMLMITGCESTLSVEVARGDSLTLTTFSPQITGVVLRQQGGSTVRLNSDALRNRDLETVSSGSQVILLDSSDVPVARYTGIALTFASSGGTVTTTLDGTELDVIPVAGAFAAIDLQVSEDDAPTLRVTLEPHLSVTDQRTTTTTQARFLPVVRAGQPGDLRQITGTVSAALVQGVNCRNAPAPAEGAAIYAYAVQDLSAADYLEGAQINPVAVGAITHDAPAYRYRIGNLPAGDYTLAMFCAADTDAPATAEGLTPLRSIEFTLGDRDATVDLTS